MEKLHRFRDDLIVKRNIKDDGSIYYVIKDPITNAFFMVGEAEYFIIQNFDGKKSLAEIAIDFKNKFSAEFEETDILEFAGQLQALCFLDNDLTRQELLRKQREVGRETKKSLFSRLLYIKLKAINPGRLFDVLIEYVRFFFTKKFVWMASVSIIIAVMVAIYNGQAMADGLSSLLNLQGIIIIYVSMFFVVITHEFAHGLTCKFYGGNVQDIGFLLLYFQPSFYCNVSDSWLFTEKSKRLWVSFSGAFIQLFVWSLAVFVWRITAEDILISKIALAVTAFSGIASLFNFNPLLKYDGYYLLSDYLEIPNLRKKVGMYWKALIRNIFLKNNHSLEVISARERKIYFYYGILSFIYIIFILGYFFLLLAGYLVSQLGGTGFMIFAALMIFLFRNIIVETAKETGEVLKARRGFLRRGTTIASFLIALATVMVIVFWGTWGLRIKGELVLNPLRSLNLKYR